MNNLTKYMEIFFFILINILFASSILFLYLGSFLGEPFYKITNMNDLLAILLLIADYLIYILLKLVLFPILYKKMQIFPNIHKFFNIIFQNKECTIFTFSIISILLVLTVYIEDYFAYETFFSLFIIELIYGIGLLPSYLVMYFVVKKHRKQK